MGNRTKGSGSICLVNGVYKLRYMVHGKRKQVSLETTNQKDARKKAAAILSPEVAAAKTKAEVVVHLAAAKEIIHRTQFPIYATWKRYLESVSRPRSGQGTLGNYERQVNRFVRWVGENFPEVECVEDVNTAIASDYARFMQGCKLSPETFNQHIKTLRLVFRTLLSNHDTPKTPVVFDHVQLLARNTVNRQAFTHAQLEKILSAFEEDAVHLPHKEEFKILFHIGAWTGLRLSDAISLQKKDVNLIANSILVTPRKTARISRKISIPVHPKLREVLAGANASRASSHLMPAIFSMYFNKTSKKRVMASIKKVFKHAELETNQMRSDRKVASVIYGFHSFRHSFASFAANAGVPIGVLSDILGDNIATLQKYYIHINDETKVKAIAAMPDFQKGKQANIKEEIAQLLHQIQDNERLDMVLALLKQFTPTA